MTDVASPLVQSRRRDVEQRRGRVETALQTMRVEAAEITISGVAARAGVHRSFIHRHADLRAAVLAAADEPAAGIHSSSTTVSRKSLQADNANLRDRNNRLAVRVRDLEDRLGEVLGAEAFERSGLGAATGTRQLELTIERQQQEILDLKQRLDERDEELDAVREAHRNLMKDFNKSSS